MFSPATSDPFAYQWSRHLLFTLRAANSRVAQYQAVPNARYWFVPNARNKLVPNARNIVSAKGAQYN